MTVLENGKTRIIVPEGAHLRVVLMGHESTPVDMLPHAAALMEAAKTSGTPAADEGAEVDNVDFARLECSDDIVFEYDGTVIDQAEALDLIAGSILGAVLAAAQ